jgi:hypothetical protein
MPLLNTDLLYDCMARSSLTITFVSTGSNWGNNASWLAQAPGPGKNNDGLGFFPREISASANTIDVESGVSLFQESWKGHWMITPSSNPGPTPSPPPKPSKGLSGGAIAGIVVGTVAAIAVLAVILFFVMRRRKRAAKAEENVQHSPVQSPYFETKSPYSDRSPIAPSELDGRGHRWSELDATQKQGEMGMSAEPQELSAGRHA